jgi:hypothetical protein
VSNVNHSRRAALGALASVPALVILPAAAVSGSTLAALSKAFEAAWEVERAACANGPDDEFERAYLATSDVV